MGRLLQRRAIKKIFRFFDAAVIFSLVVNPIGIPGLLFVAAAQEVIPVEEIQLVENDQSLQGVKNVPDVEKSEQKEVIQISQDSVSESKDTETIGGDDAGESKENEKKINDLSDANISPADFVFDTLKQSEDQKTENVLFSTVPEGEDLVLQNGVGVISEEAAAVDAVMIDTEQKNEESSQEKKIEKGIDSDVSVQSKTSDETINIERGVWRDNGDGSRTILVERGHEYAFGDSGLKIRFSKLPETPGDITVREVKLSSEQMNELDAVTQSAWDITSSMKNGTFSYDLILPVNMSIDPEKVDVVYAEDVNILNRKKNVSFIEEKKVNVNDDGMVSIDNLDHFTVFVVTWNFPNNPDNVFADGGIGANLTQSLTAIGTNAPIFSTSGATTNSASATGWDNGNDLKYWKIKFQANGFQDLTLSSKQRSSSTGPKKFKVQYSFDDSSWNDISSGNVTVSDNFTNGIVSHLSLPSVVNDKDAVYVRWIMTSNSSVGGGNVGSSGTSRIDDVVVRGTRMNMDPSLNPDAECVKDSDGGNDQPGQRDLTRLCRNFDKNNPLEITWNWDEISMSGNNTADACALFDADSIGNTGYGLADYAVCVSWDKDGHMLSDYPKLYSCNDTRSDRCSGHSAIVITHGTYCDVSRSDDDPFGSGTNFPLDMQAYCSIHLEDIGSSNKSEFLDACSFPSKQPNSDPSDCISQSSKKGNIQVNKDVIPNDSSTRWDVAVERVQSCGSSEFSDVLIGDDTTGIRSVEPGMYTISEKAHAGTDMRLYDAAFSCLKNGDFYRMGTGTSVTVSAEKGDLVQCTFTNTLKSATVTVVKRVVNDNGGNATVRDFGISFSGGALSFDEGTSEDGATVYTSHSIMVKPGVLYTLSEKDIDEYEEGSWNCGSVSEDGVSAELSLRSGQNVICTITNDDKAASLSVCKFNDYDGNGRKDESESFLSGWAMTVQDIDGRKVAQGVTGRDGCVVFDTLNPGDYSVLETQQNGWYATGGDVHDVTLSFDEQKTVYMGNREYGSVTIVKKTEGGDGVFSFGGSFGDFSLETKNGESSKTISDLIPGNSYALSENSVFGWDFRSAVCDRGNIDAIEVIPGKETVCTFFNVKRAELAVTKFEDENENGIFDEGERTLSGWEILLSPVSESESEADYSSARTDENGQVVFENVVSGSYVLSEVLQSGWEQTGMYCAGDELRETDGKNHLVVSLSIGDTQHCYIGNVPVGILYIQKSNNANGTKNAGETVTYTIKVRAQGGKVKNVHITDLPPKSFEFVSGTESAYSIDRGMLSGALTHAYASPGTWSIGDLVSGEEVILTYEAMIGVNTDAGTYPDVAYAKGVSGGEDILAIAEESGYVDANFVGTKVAVAALAQSVPSKVTVNHKEIVEKEKVLGVSTLPETGIHVFLIATLFGVMGFGVVLFGIGSRDVFKRIVRERLSSKKFFSFLFLLGVSLYALFFSNSVYAASSVMVRAEEPKAVSGHAFQMDYVTLDAFGHPVFVECLVKSPSDTSFRMFESLATQNGGNSGRCTIDSVVLSDNGTYVFKVRGTVGGDVTESAEYSVVYDALLPGKPKWIKKHDAFCAYTIEFKTSDDSQTVRAEVYRSLHQDFIADESTRVADVSVGSGVEYSYMDTLSVSGCDKKFYYAVRAFDAAGNASPIREEELEDVVKKKFDIESDAVFSSERVLSESFSGQQPQEVKGEQDTAAAEKTSGESEKVFENQEGQVAGESVERKEFFPATWLGNNWWRILLVLGVVFVLYARRKLKSSDKQ